MRRGTTPTITFNLPFGSDTLDEAYITFAQANEILFEKTLEDCALGETSLSITLTQEESLKFKSDVAIKMQIRALNGDNVALASNIMSCNVNDIIKQGVI